MGAAALSKVPGLKKAPATGAGVLSSVVKAAEEGASTRDRLGGLARGAGTGAAVGGLAGAAHATQYMTGKPGIFSRMTGAKRTWGGAVKRLGAGIIAGGAIGGGIGAMRAKNSGREKAANVLGCTLWGERSSPFAGHRTNPFATGVLKAANVLGPSPWGERISPFAGRRENPFARDPAPASMPPSVKRAAKKKDDDSDVHYPVSRSVGKGALVGGAIGAGLGGAVGATHPTHGGGKGALIGAGIGGGVGALSGMLHGAQYGYGRRSGAQAARAGGESPGFGESLFQTPAYHYGKRRGHDNEQKRMMGKAASSSEGGLESSPGGMAEAFEKMLEGSVDPYRGFDYSKNLRLKVAAALARN